MKKRIFNFRFLFFNSGESGYTLVELLAVLFVLVTVGSIVASILISSLRGSNRATTVNEVRQNGDQIIGQMSKMISYARAFQGVSTDGINYLTDCIVTPTTPPAPSPTPVPYTYIKITSFDGGDTVFSCLGASIASNGANLINTSTLSVSSCSFYCSQNNVSSSPIINIQFTLSKINSGLFVENLISVPFDTSITLRN